MNTKRLAAELELLSSPGDTILELMADKGFTVNDLADKLDMHVFQVDELIDGDIKINYDIAIGLEKSLGIDAQFWINREYDYRRQLEEINPQGAQRLKRFVERYGNNLAYSESVHPGIILKQVVERRKLIKKGIAKALGIQSANLSAIFRGTEPVSSSRAIQLEAILGIDAGFWVRLQGEYELAVLRNPKHEKK